MRIEQIIKLTALASRGDDNFNEGAVGSNGYGFTFKDLHAHPDLSFITSINSHKFCSAGAYRGYAKRLESRLGSHYEFDGFPDMLRYHPKRDLLLVGSLKTLLPTLQFGGVELLFEVWMYVITPDDRKFPATFYWGPSGLSIGGWSRSGPFFNREVDSLESISEYINFSPFELSEDGTGQFLDALEFSLRKVPVSDFWGVYTYDLGNSYMGVKGGKPFIEHMKHFKRDPEAELEVKPLLSKCFKTREGESFSIKLLPRGVYMKVYALLFEDEWDIFFGNARDVLEYYYELIDK